MAITSWLFSLVLGLAGAMLCYLIFTVWIGIGDTDVFDGGGMVAADHRRDDPAAVRRCLRPHAQRGTR